MSKFTTLHTNPSLKPVHSQISKIISLVTGAPVAAPAVTETKPVATKSVPPATLLPDLEIVTSQKPSIIDLPIFDPPKESKPDAFTFMNQLKPAAPVAAVPSAGMPGLFANLNLKTSSEPVAATMPAQKPAAPVAPQSSFSFMKPAAVENKPAVVAAPIAQTEKKPVLQGLDLDFAATDVPPQRPADLLSGIDLGGHFDNVPIAPPRPIVQQPQAPFYAPAGAKPGLIPQTLFAKDEVKENKNDDKYFGFVNEHFGEDWK